MFAVFSIFKHYVSKMSYNSSKSCHSVIRHNVSKAICLSKILPPPQAFPKVYQYLGMKLAQKEQK